MKLHLLLFTFLQILLSASAENLLVLGDSWASLSGDFLSYVCSPLSLVLGDAADTEGITLFNVQNDAKSGSTAAKWASGELARKSFKNSDFDYVWLSVGGNDFLSGCDMEKKQEIADNILSVISHIVESSLNDDIKILYFGYGIPTADVCGGGTTAARMEEISDYIQDSISSSAFSSYVTLVDITSDFVTPQSAPLSDARWFADSIHINEYGYFKIFSLQAIQEFFGCIEPSSSSSPTSANATMSDAPSSFSSDAPFSSPTDSSSSAPSYAPFVVPSSASPSGAMSSSPISTSDAPSGTSSETTAPTSETDAQEDGILSEVGSFFQDVKNMISSSSESSCRKRWMPWFSVGLCLVALLR